MLHLIDVHKSFGARSLLSGLSWHIGPRQRIGLVGRNGVGKTTLFRIVAGECSIDDGEVVKAKHVRIGYLAQEAVGLDDKIVIDVVLEAAEEWRSLSEERDELEVAMAEAAGDHALLASLLARYEEVDARFEALGGHSVEAEARRILAGLGFLDDRMDGPMNTLSGGWAMRVILARLLLARPDLLLLDEPTNHLDLEALLWFETFLSQYEGAVVVVSHDRVFLNGFVDRIAEMTSRGIDVYTGDYDAYEAQRAIRREQQEAEAKGQKRSLAHDERFIERFRYKSSKAKAVQSRIKALEKVDRIELPDRDEGVMRLRFPQPPRSGKEVAILRNVTKRYGDLTVYEGLDLTVYRGERIALVGPNGAGKTTLLKLLAGTLDINGGELRLGSNVARAYYAQHQLEALDVRHTVLAELESIADIDQHPRCRSVLGAFRFSGDDVDKKVAVLSGGEKARLALAKLLLTPPNLLLLDEPTNHLDMQSRDMLEGALSAYEGTLILISHDRHFINAIATHVIEVVAGQITRFPGHYDDYMTKRARADAAAKAAGPNVRARPSRSKRRSDKDRRRAEAEARNALHQRVRPLREELAKVERRVADVEEALAQGAVEMVDPAIFEDTDAMRRIYEGRARLEDEQTDLLVRWEALGTAIEKATAQFEDELEGIP